MKKIKKIEDAEQIHRTSEASLSNTALDRMARKNNNLTFIIKYNNSGPS